MKALATSALLAICCTGFAQTTPAAPTSTQLRIAALSPGHDYLTRAANQLYSTQERMSKLAVCLGQPELTNAFRQRVTACYLDIAQLWKGTKWQTPDARVEQLGVMMQNAQLNFEFLERNPTPAQFERANHFANEAIKEFAKFPGYCRVAVAGLDPESVGIAYCQTLKEYADLITQHLEQTQTNFKVLEIRGDKYERKFKNRERTRRVNSSLDASGLGGDIEMQGIDAETASFCDGINREYVNSDRAARLRLPSVATPQQVAIYDQLNTFYMGARNALKRLDAAVRSENEEEIVLAMDAYLKAARHLPGKPAL